MKEFVAGSGQEILEPEVTEFQHSSENQFNVDTALSLAARRHGLELSESGRKYSEAVQFASDLANKEMSERAGVMQQMLMDGDLSPEELFQFDLEPRTNPLTDQAVQGATEEVQMTEELDDAQVNSAEPAEVSLYIESRLNLAQAEFEEKFSDQGFLGQAYDILSTIVYGEEEIVMNNLRSAFGVESMFPEEIIDGVAVAIRMAPTKDDAEERINLLLETLENADFADNHMAIASILGKITDYSMADRYWDQTVVPTMLFDIATLGASAVGRVAKSAKVAKDVVESADTSKYAQQLGVESSVTGPVSHGALPEDATVVNGIDGKSLEDAHLPTLDDEELEAAAKVQTESLREELGQRFPATYDIDWKNIPVDYEKGQAGSATISMYIGKANDYKTGFKYKDAAEHVSGYYPGSVVEQGDGGRFWVKITKDVNPYKARTVETSALSPVGKLKGNLVAKFGSADFMSDDDIGNAFRHLTFDARTKLRDDVNRMYEPMLQWSRKNKKEGANLKNIMLSGQKSAGRDGKGRGIWWNKEEFARQWTENPAKLDEAWGQYQDFKRIDDMMFTKKNESLRVKLNKEGYTQVNVQGIDPFVGRQVRFNRPSKAYDPVSNKLVDVTDEYTVYRTGDLGRKEFVAVKGQTETSLPQYVINRTEGGRISYNDNEWFAKVDPGEGKSKIAVAAGRSKEEGEAFVKSLNESGEIYTKYKTGAISATEADRLLEMATAPMGNMGLETFEEFIKEYKLVNKDGSFRKADLLYEGASGGREVDTDVMEEIAGIGSLYTTRRTGKTLRGFTSDEAPLMDPLAAQYEAMQRTINLMTVEPYLARVQRTFRENGRSLLHPDMNGKSDAEVFANPKWKDGPDEVEQDMINRLTLLKQTTDRSFQQVTQWDKELMKHFRGTRLEQPAGWLLSQNPVNFLRGVTFDMYLGMFSIRQAWLQASGIINTMAVTPRAGFKAATLAPSVRMALAKPDMVAHIGKMVEKTTGAIPGMGKVTAKEFEQMVGDVAKSGKHIIGQQVAEISNEDGAKLLKDAGGRAIWHPQSIRAGGRAFFNEGERLNRLVGYLASREEHLRAGGKLKSVKDYAKVTDRAEVLTMRMTSASKAEWNEGLLALPTQFWNYQIRWFENILGSRLSGGERIRLAATTLGLYGTAGTIGGVPALQLTGLLPEDLPDEARRAVHFGAMTTFVDMMYESLGMEAPGINYAELGPQLATNQIVEAMWDGMNGVEDINMFNTIFGASANAFTRVVGVSGNLMHTMASASENPWGTTTKNFIGHLASITKSGEDYTAAYMIYRYNTDQNFRQGLKKLGVDSEQAFYRAIGLKTTNDTLRYDLQKLGKHERATYNDRVGDTVSALKRLNAGMISHEDYMEIYTDNLKASPTRFQDRYMKDVAGRFRSSGESMTAVIMKTLEMEGEFGGLINE